MIVHWDWGESNLCCKLWWSVYNQSQFGTCIHIYLPNFTIIKNFRMFRVLCVILLISVSEGSFDLPSNVRALLSEDFNVTAGELIVAGEAEKLNLTAKEHLAYCAGKSFSVFFVLADIKIMTPLRHRSCFLILSWRKAFNERWKM